MRQAALETIDATKIYNFKKPNEVISVSGATLKIPPESITILRGPSGAGKTTLLSMIGCQIKPTRGHIIIKGKTVSKLPEKFANLYKRIHIGFVFQHYRLLPDLNVFENIILPLLPMGIAIKERHKRADKLVEEFNLVNRKRFKVKNLSSGEQQRVAIARALINKSTILLADEPTAHLDSRLSNDFMIHMTRLKQSGHAVLIASHDPVVFQHSEVDRILEMKDGKVVS